MASRSSSAARPSGRRITFLVVRWLTPGVAATLVCQHLGTLTEHAMSLAGTR